MTDYATERSEVPAEFKQEGPPLASEKQIKFIEDLLEYRVVPDPTRALIERDRESLTKKAASRYIDQLLKLPYLKHVRPRESATNVDIPSVDVLPKGRYAIESEEDELRFYYLWRGDRKPDYIKLYVQHGPDESEIPFMAALSICRKIVEAGPRECAIRYGRELKRCHKCDTRLTNRLSRELCIGPICGGRWYEEEEWKQVKREAREAIIARGEDPEEEVSD